MLLNRENQCESFEWLGMVDPFGSKKAIQLAEKTVREFEIDKSIYPEDISKIMYEEIEA